MPKPKQFTWPLYIFWWLADKHFRLNVWHKEKFGGLPLLVSEILLVVLIAVILKCLI